MNFKKTFALLALMTAATLSYGQAVSTTGGSIQGTISDPSGAAIPGATVVITEPATGYTHSLTTDKAGFYSLGPLVPGEYTISVSAANFEGLNVKTVVRTGTATSGSEKLTIGKSSETIQVDAGALQINTDQIGVSGVVTREQIDTLPVNGRNILDIAQIQPGVILQSGESFDPTKAGYSAVSVGGVGGRTTRILLDGQDITDETVGTTIFNVPSGAIEEFQLNRSTQDVSGEVTSSGGILVSTQSGTNKFHGNLFYNFQDNRAGFATVFGQDSPFQRNQFGGYVGGPIIKDKLFFFGGIERIKQAEEDSAGTNPYFPTITAEYPLVPAPFRDTYSTLRLDYSGPHGIHFFARAVYSVNADASTFGYGPYAIYQNRDNVPGLVGGADFVTGKFTHSFRVGYEKFHNILGDETAALGNTIYNPSTGPTNQISLVGSINAGPNFLAPQQTYQSDKQFRYDGTWTKGAHTIRFGGSFNRILNGGFADFYGPALYTDVAAISAFQVSQCGNVGIAPVTGPCPGDPVNGYIAAIYVLGNGNGLFSERPGFGLTGGGDPSWRVAGYGADTWKVASSLTVTAGLRWGVDTDRANQDLPTPLCSSVAPAFQFAGCTGDTPLFDQYGSTDGSGTLGYKTHQPYGNFGPQAGMVFSPGNHRTSLRLGAGIYYESDIFNNTGNARTESIQTPGAYFNYGAVGPGQTSIYLPGYGSVASIDDVSGAPCTTPGTGTCTALANVLALPISQAAPLMNGLKAVYQTAEKGVVSANPSYIGTGDALFANNIYAGPYKSPYSIQLNGGVQHELKKGLVLSADYVHNATLKVPLSVDVNKVGAASTLNTTAAANAIANTLAFCGATTISATIVPGGCPNGSGVGANGQPNGTASITDFSANGLDSSSVVYGGPYPAQAVGATPNTGAAFAGINANVGEGLFILPVGRSGYDALQVVLQQQKSHPVPGITSSNLQISYTLSRIVTSVGGGTQDQFFAGARAVDNDNPNAIMGRNSIDHSNELSLGGSLGVKYGLQVAFIGHFYSAPPTTLRLDTGGTSAGQIFQTDLDGDGQTGDLLPGTLPGSYMHSVKGAGLNKLISRYNAQSAGQLTPAGQALVNAGLFTQQQLSALNAVQQPLGLGSNNPLNTPMFRDFGLNASYPIKLGKFHEGLTITPGVAMYNVFNMGNFGGYSGTVLNAADDSPASQAAGLTQGYLNGNNTTAPGGAPVLNSYRVQRGSGTFDAGGPRSTEFQLKIAF